MRAPLTPGQVSPSIKKHLRYLPQHPMPIANVGQGFQKAPTPVNTPVNVILTIILTIILHAVQPAVEEVGADDVGKSVYV